MPSSKSLTTSKTRWENSHTQSLLEVMVSFLMSNRPAIYKYGNLAEVAEHGGDRVNAKLKQILRQLCVTHHFPDLFDDVTKPTQGKKSAWGAQREEKKEGEEIGGSKKKRKVKEELD